MALLGKNSPANARDVKDMGFNTWVGKMPWRRAWQSTPVFLPWRGTWWATVHRVVKNQTWPKWLSTRTHTHTHTHTHTNTHIYMYVYICIRNLTHLYLPTIYQVPLDFMWATNKYDLFSQKFPKQNWKKKTKYHILPQTPNTKRM